MKSPTGKVALAKNNGNFEQAVADIITYSILNDDNNKSSSSQEEFLLRSYILGRDQFGNFVSVVQDKECSGPCVVTSYASLSMDNVYYVESFRCFSFVRRNSITLASGGRYNGAYSCSDVSDAGIYANTSARLVYDGVNNPITFIEFDWGCMDFIIGPPPLPLLSGGSSNFQ